MHMPKKDVKSSKMPVNTRAMHATTPWAVCVWLLLLPLLGTATARPSLPHFNIDQFTDLSSDLGTSTVGGPQAGMRAGEISGFIPANIESLLSSMMMNKNPVAPASAAPQSAGGIPSVLEGTGGDNTPSTKNGGRNGRGGGGSKARNNAAAAHARVLGEIA